MPKLTTMTSEAVVVLLLLVAAALVVFYTYIYHREARQTRRLTRRQVWTLRLLRVGAAVLVIFALARPVLTITEHRSESPVVPILIDGSQSMTFDDARENPLVRGPRQSRYESAKIVLDKLMDPLIRKHDIRLYKFSHDLKLITALDSRGEKGKKIEDAARLFPDIDGRPDAATGGLTDITASGTAGLNNMGDSKVSGMIVITDGRQNSGAPLAKLIELAQSDRVKVPVHTVVLGSEYPLRDLRLDDLNGPPDASLGDVLTLQAKITNDIDDSLATELTLYEANDEEYKKAGTAEAQKKLFRQVAKRPIRLRRGQQAIEISCIPETEGDRVFRAELPVMADEVNVENNSAVLTVHVAKKGLKVLLIAGEPGREYDYLAPALLRDPVINLSCYLQSADVDYKQQGNTNIELLPETQKQWSYFDVAILLDVDPVEHKHPLTVQQIAGLESMVSKGGGLLIVGGRNQGLAKLLTVHALKLREMLPIEIDKNDHPQIDRFYEESFTVGRTRDGRLHPVLRMNGDDRKNEEIWSTFPKFYWAHPAVKIARDSISLLETTSDVPTIPKGRCVMAVKRYHEGSVVYLGLDSVWLWRNPYEDFDYDKFWTRTIRYLGETKLKGGQQQVTLSTDRRSYAPGETITLQLRVLDPALMNQLADQKLYAKVAMPKGGEDMILLERSADGEPAFIGTYRTKRVGSLKATAQHTGTDSEAKKLFDVKYEFQVQHQSLEAKDTSADLEGMRVLSESTGGKHFNYRNMNDLATLLDDFPADPKVITRKNPVDIWDGLTFLLIFLMLVSAEWSLRKWWGLL